MPKVLPSNFEWRVIDMCRITSLIYEDYALNGKANFEAERYDDSSFIYKAGSSKIKVKIRRSDNRCWITLPTTSEHYCTQPGFPFFIAMSRYRKAFNRLNTIVKDVNGILTIDQIVDKHLMNSFPTLINEVIEKDLLGKQ